MKKTLILITGLLVTSCFQCFSQEEKEVKSTISNVTVFSKSAQIVNESVINLLPGKTLLNFTNLSPYINKESIRVEGNGSFTILNVQSKTNFKNKLEKTKEIEELNKSIESFHAKKEDEETRLKILNEKQEFLSTNKNVTGKDQTLNPELFKSLIDIYGSNIEKNALEILKVSRQIKLYDKEIANLKRQLNETNSKKDLPSGEISILVSSDKTVYSKILLTYLVENAGWYPTYDIRFTASNQPITVSYKANITQNTGVDWANVKLKLSNAKTQVSAQIPTLYPSYLRFFTPIIPIVKEEYDKGDISDNISSKSSGAGNNSKINIRGMGGLEGNAKPLYVVDGVIVENIDNYNPDDIDKMEVLKGTQSTDLFGDQGANGAIMITTKQGKNRSTNPITSVSKKETSKEFIIDGLQSILTNGKVNTIKFRDSLIKASYEFKAIPKLAENVYLMGKISDWFNTDISDGEVNIYSENSFVGKSAINSQQFTDTLDISFGVDNNISVKREKIRDFSESKFIGLTKKETIGWKIKVRNNKSTEINAKIIDQIPVSTIKDIQVETLEMSGGLMNGNTGEVEWKFPLKPNETKEIILKYSIKYPKDKKIIFE